MQHHLAIIVTFDENRLQTNQWDPQKDLTRKENWAAQIAICGSQVCIGTIVKERPRMVEL